jgi:hypothetical protein
LSFFWLPLSVTPTITSPSPNFIKMYLSVNSCPSPVGSRTNFGTRWHRQFVTSPFNGEPDPVLIDVSVDGDGRPLWPVDAPEITEFSTFGKTTHDMWWLSWNLGFSSSTIIWLLGHLSWPNLRLIANSLNYCPNHRWH